MNFKKNYLQISLKKILKLFQNIFRNKYFTYSFIILFISILIFTPFYIRQLFQFKRVYNVPENVKIFEAKKYNISEEIILYGKIYSNQIINAKSKITENIKEIHFKDGDFVKKGDLLISFDKRNANIRLNISKINLDKKKTEYNRIKKLYNRKAVSKRDYDIAKYDLLLSKEDHKDAKLFLSYHEVRAHFDGYISLSQLSSGALINQGQELFTLHDYSKFFCDFAASYNIFNKIDLNKNIQVILDKTYNITSQIKYHENFIQDNSYNILLRSELTKNDIGKNLYNKLKSGQFVKIKAKSKSKQNIMIPNKAIIYSGNNHYIFVMDKDKKIGKKRITIGISQNYNIKDDIITFTEITSPIKEGENIVINNIIKLRDNVTLNNIEFVKYQLNNIN